MVEGRFADAVAVTVALLPVAALAVWALARRRPWVKALAEVGMVDGTAPWVWMIMLPGGRAGEEPGRISLVPLRDLVTRPAAGLAALTSRRWWRGPDRPVEQLVAGACPGGSSG